MLPREMPLMTCWSSSLMRAGNGDRYGVGWSGPDRLFEDQLAVLDRQDDGRFRRIALAVQRNCSGDSVVVLGRGDRIAQFGAVGRPGAPDRLEIGRASCRERGE